MAAIPWILLAGINLLACLAYSVDKLAAIRGWRRISEARLLLLAAIGGTLGALVAMKTWRHKTAKRPFLWRFLGAGCLGAAVDAGLIVWALR